MKVYSVWFGLLHKIANKKLQMLLNAFGSAEAVYNASTLDLVTALPTLDIEDVTALSQKSLDHAEKICHDCVAIGAEIVDITDETYPQLLKNINNPPIVLYIRGNLPALDAQSLTIGMVGQRKATVNGMRNASKIAYELSKNGVIVVSGMAAGIDSSSHKGALDGGSPTIAVLGTAIDVCYPAGNAGLMRRIIENGAVISEYPPGAATPAKCFLARNRIVSGLSRGVLVVEAAERSGSLVTARLALEQDRDLFAVPGPIDVRDYRGTNKLIKQGAMVVTSSADVLGEYGYIEAPRPHRQAEPKPAPPEYKEDKYDDEGLLSELDRDILRAIGKISHIDVIIERLGLSAGEVMARLTVLEVLGMITQRPGNYFESKQ